MGSHVNCIENNHMKRLLMIFFLRIRTRKRSPGGHQPPTFRLTAERANRLLHGDFHVLQFLSNLIVWIKIFTYIRFQPHYRIFLARIDERKTGGLKSVSV